MHRCADPFEQDTIVPHEHTTTYYLLAFLTFIQIPPSPKLSSMWINLSPSYAFLRYYLSILMNKNVFQHLVGYNVIFVEVATYVRLKICNLQRLLKLETGECRVNMLITITQFEDFIGTSPKSHSDQDKAIAQITMTKTPAECPQKPSTQNQSY